MTGDKVLPGRKRIFCCHLSAGFIRHFLNAPAGDLTANPQLNNGKQLQLNRFRPP